MKNFIFLFPFLLSTTTAFAGFSTTSRDLLEECAAESRERIAVPPETASSNSWNGNIHLRRSESFGSAPPLKNETPQRATRFTHKRFHSYDSEQLPSKGMSFVYEKKGANEKAEDSSHGGFLPDDPPRSFHSASYDSMESLENQRVTASGGSEDDNGASQPLKAPSLKDLIDLSKPWGIDLKSALLRESILRPSLMDRDLFNKDPATHIVLLGRLLSENSPPALAKLPWPRQHEIAELETRRKELEKELFDLREETKAEESQAKPDREKISRITERMAMAESESQNLEQGIEHCLEGVEIGDMNPAMAASYVISMVKSKRCIITGMVEALGENCNLQVEHLSHLPHWQDWKGPIPLKTYADRFTQGLRKEVKFKDLETKYGPKPIERRRSFRQKLGRALSLQDLQDTYGDPQPTGKGNESSSEDSQND